MTSWGDVGVSGSRLGIMASSERTSREMSAGVEANASSNISRFVMPCRWAHHPGYLLEPKQNQGRIIALLTDDHNAADSKIVHPSA